MTASHDDIESAFEASWPAADYAEAGAFRVGRGLGGGKRVASARAVSSDWTDTDIDDAIEIHRRWNQPAIFRVLDGEDRLAAALQSRGFRGHTRTRMMMAPVSALTDLAVPPVTSFAVWPPLAIQHELWAEQGIGRERQAVMARVRLNKAALLGRIEDRAAAVGFIAAAGDVAVLHALEVLPAMRRKGLAGWMMREAAFWAKANGAKSMLLAVTAENTGAVALYQNLGFSGISAYRYFQP
ncbi:GNAT family N-acetyltransferase [Paracoccus albus]|uniref:GNAT family N-acetyltransferase n=1 Tax=Paracoccus albus TaxID=3017784 RepID=UPI0022F0102E|nr:GNAT family N-acetyltransferase [Paracoccus albus]WBU61795.1 GNAT family N-acetyltransferase [Paracoccus albus]